MPNTWNQSEQPGTKAVGAHKMQSYKVGVQSLGMNNRGAILMM